MIDAYEMSVLNQLLAKAVNGPEALRIRFAAAALQGILSRSGVAIAVESMQQDARDAFDYADAMLAELDRREAERNQPAGELTEAGRAAAEEFRGCDAIGVTCTPPCEFESKAECDTALERAFKPA